MMVLSNFSSLVRLKVLLQLMHAFFSHSPKKHLEFQKLCEVFRKRRNKLFMNVKTMDNYVIFYEMCYGTISTPNYKIHVDVPKSNIANENLSLLYAQDFILELHVIILLLDFVHVLIKMPQFHDVFIYHFIDAMKVCQLELYQCYVKPYTKFDNPTFDELHVLESFNNKNFLMNWCTNLNKKLDYLIIEFASFNFFCQLMFFYIKFFETCIEAKFPFDYGSCEIKS